MVHAEFREPDLAGILEPVGVAQARKSIFVIAVDGAGPARAGHGDDRALVVRMIIEGRQKAGARIAVERHVVPHAVHIAADHRAILIFRDQRIAVIIASNAPFPCCGLVRP